MLGDQSQAAVLTSKLEPIIQMAWQQLMSPCLWEHVNILVHLAFLGILFFYFLRDFVCKSFKRMTKIRDQNHSVDVKFNLVYKCSISFCTLLLVAHFAQLLFLLNGQATNCESIMLSISSRIMQAASSLIILIVVLRIRYSQFPWIIRLWWICGFLVSIICIFMDTYFRVTKHGQFSARDYMNFLSVVSSMFLFGVSIHGKTGIVCNSFDKTICDPLLQVKAERYSGGEKSKSPYGNATLVQLITFSWLNPLFAVGFKKPLEQDEIPGIDIKDSAGFLSPAFDECLNQVKGKERTTDSFGFYKAIFLFIRKKAAINALFAVINAGATYVGPYLIKDLVNFLTEKNTRSLKSGYFLTLAFLCAKMIETIAQRQWIFGARQLGLRLRAALISHIYKKGLLLSSQSRQSYNSGEIINYMSVDIERITDFTWFLNIIWMLPIQISLGIFVLNTSLGLGSFATLGATFGVLMCNIPITRIQKHYQSKIMEAKDNRMKATSEVLQNMKILKLQAWDNQFLHKLESLRITEYNWLWKSLRLSAISAFVFWGAPAFISVTTFGACMLMGIQLTAGRVLSAFATFRMLQEPIFNLPDLLSAIAQGKVSADRVALYLQEGEISFHAVDYIPKDQTEFEVEIEDGKFIWDVHTNKPTLDKINLKVQRGMKVAICGSVGSGKSSLLSSILGEIQKQSGTVKISGTKAYVPQSPWILTGNIRDNILFGNSFDSDKYYRTVEACALIKDFELFECGDLTEIGERGINMSGGQKQRIQIARAIYQDSDIYLLDDPFSAVDAHTGTQLFQECLMGILKDKTVLYVTHQVEFLPAADLILVMQDGKIAQAGTFQELMKQNIGFEILVGAHSQALESVLKVENSSKTSQRLLQDSESKSETSSNTNLSSIRQESNHDLTSEITEKGAKLVQDEEREKGSIGKEVYWTYLTTVKRGALIPIILLTQSLFQVLQIASNYWMAWAVPITSESRPIMEMNTILLVYVLLAFGGSIFILIRATIVAKVGLATAQKMFTNMLHSVFRAPMSFFDSTPTGRILNRASTDQSVLDLEMGWRLGFCAYSIIQMIGTIAVMSQVAWQVFVIFIPVTAICIWYQRYYIPTARELARLAGIQRSPILHHFAESLAGAATIRAFDQKHRFIETNLGLIDNYARPWFYNVAAMEWLSFRLNILSNFVFGFSLVVLVTLPEGVISPSIAGLAITYGINLNLLQAAVIWNLCNAENKMISVERVLQYKNIKSEAPLVLEDRRPPYNWPETGEICFKDLEIRYAEHLPSVLKSISCTFPGRKKVGVVGRTGSGKSTLIQALFRIIEARQGSIVIDSVDISMLGLHDLRSRLSIIPQDPTMFEGTVRGNLDPLGQYSDSEVWEALDKCQLGEMVRSKNEKLESQVIENGENWSVGQRQLFCLGRALLKKSNILVLDEATASVDSATDGEIQRIIGKEFSQRTVITIAHRIHTVIDSDLVLVLSDGRVAEYDTPERLLEREDSIFSKLIKEYSMRSQSLNDRGT